LKGVDKNMDHKILYNIFDHQTLEVHPDEWGVTIHCPEPDALGFATTLTPAVVEQARTHNVNLLVTHHDAWDFMLEEKSVSHELLSRYKISHIWCHTPLDAADFGTSAALLAVLDCKLIGIIAEGDGRVGDLPLPCNLSDVTSLLNDRLSESPCRMNDAGRPITRIACVTGAGASIKYLSEALAFNADLYITGETSLYLLEYARFRNISALIYSHNYTEILGTQNLATRVAAQLGIKTVIRLDEPHF
jgi:putative NIF3 family GTP cyclohydrolase 1 type 2